MRGSYYLTDGEVVKFSKLGNDPKAENGDHVWIFWRDVAHDRGLDYMTIIGDQEDPHVFTGLPKGHGKQWCYPIKLKCNKAAKSVVI